MKRVTLLALMVALLFIGCTQPKCSEDSDCYGKEIPVKCMFGGEWKCIEEGCMYECLPSDPLPLPPSDIQNETNVTEPERPFEVEIVSFSTDKEEYGSSEKVMLSLSVNSSREVKDANVTVKGIKPRYQYYIDKTRLVDLEKGVNELGINATTPRCTSGCGGVNPGYYKITAEVSVNETIMDSQNTTIKLHA